MPSLVSAAADSDGGEAAALPGTLQPPAAQERLGAEAIVRLRGRYAEVLARISERVQDPVRRDALKVEAERLNPDSWVTDEEVRAGLEQYEAVSESLRAIVGRRRRRRSRGPRPADGPPAGDPTLAAEPGVDGPESGPLEEGVDYRTDEEG